MNQIHEQSPGFVAIAYIPVMLLFSTECTHVGLRLTAKEVQAYDSMWTTKINQSPNFRSFI